MPYLVDSVTTRLNRHQADIGLIVHPVLRVRRDVTGALREIVGVCADDVPAATDELTESWIHVEMEPPGDRVTAGQLEEDLRHVLDDVRVAVEDRTRMEAVARRLADDLGGEAGRSARGDDPAGLAASGDGPKPPARTWPSSVSCCAGWPTATSPSSATANTTWCRTGEGTSMRAVPGTGLGILRHARQGRDPLRKLSSPVAARAQDPARTAGPGQGELPVDRLPRQLPGLRLGQEASAADRERSPGSSGSSACIRTRRTPRPSPASR